MLPNDHPSVSFGKIGVLLVNLGTPDSTSVSDIRRYLREFLSDRRVIELNPVLWQVILNLFILTFRPPKVAQVYKQVWREDTDESPLRYFTRMQAKKLAERFSNNENVIVDWAMRYGNPSIKSGIRLLQEQGCDRQIIVPLYPQYAAATTATVCDEVYRTLMDLRWQPAVRITDPYESHSLYINALANSINEYKATLDWNPEKTILSFHGIPKEYFDNGDPYHCYCHKTARLLRIALNETSESMPLTFQSRFGPKEWLQPYTDKTIEQYARDGIKNLLLVTPGFSSDCIETLEEIDIAARESFIEHGGEHFATVPCLNDRDDAIDLYESLVKEVAGSWISVT